MQNPLQPFLDQQAFLVLDGALATELEKRGANLNDALWSAKILLENPELIYRVHLEYLYAGADILTTASYQASFPGFRQKGIGHQQSCELLQLSVNLARSAVEDFWKEPKNRKGRLKPLVAASIGPYGAFLADGSEYRGHYGISAPELHDFHREKVEFLANSGADLLAFETIPSVLEAEIFIHIISKNNRIKSWLSFSCKNDFQISDGTLFGEVVKMADPIPEILAIGINCTPPEHIDGLLKAANLLTQKPLIVYPNSGEGWDAEHHCWTAAEKPATLHSQALLWYRSGARIIGGCCRTGPEDIREVRLVLAY
ncbi:MAG: homocysteine S-methyltransferase YbgG [Saprospiraceae bacterium]|nr:MAG: homocysteine S-methyltransferase YbgG [Saprospiraceae bacterium]